MQAFELGCCERLASRVEDSIHFFRFQVTTDARITFFYLELVWISRYLTGFFWNFLKAAMVQQADEMLRAIRLEN